MRTRFSKVAAGEMSAPRSKRQLRNRANADLERERKILDEVLPDAATAGVVVISRVKPAIEAKLGKTLALSSVYRMLARHGWGQARTLKETLKGVKTGGKTPRRSELDRKELYHTQTHAVGVPGRGPVWANQRHPVLLGTVPAAPHG